jgi:hypothetical protein
MFHIHKVNISNGHLELLRTIHDCKCIDIMSDG